MSQDPKFERHCLWALLECSESKYIHLMDPQNRSALPDTCPPGPPSPLEPHPVTTWELKLFSSVIRTITIHTPRSLSLTTVEIQSFSSLCKALTNLYLSCVQWYLAPQSERKYLEGALTSEITWYDSGPYFFLLSQGCPSPSTLDPLPTHLLLAHFSPL